MGQLPSLHSALPWVRVLNRESESQMVCTCTASPSALPGPRAAAASGGSAGVAMALLKAGAEVTALSDTGATPLHEAAEKGHARVGVFGRDGCRVSAVKCQVVWRLPGMTNEHG